MTPRQIRKTLNGPWGSEGEITPLAPERRNLPQQIRSLGHPDHTYMMTVIGDMMSNVRADDEYSALLDEALALLIRAARLLPKRD